jgi:sugar phosphate isomerase/epimerase
MKISLGSWAFSFGPYSDDPVPFDKIVRRLSEAGYDGVEVCGFPPHVALDRYPTRQSRRELVGFIQDHNLGISGYAADFTSANPVDPDNHGKYIEAFRRNVEMAADIGSPSIRVDSVAAPGSLSDAEYRAAFDRVAELWSEAAGIAQQAGVLMVWEFEPGFVFNKPTEVQTMHQQVAHPNFKILFDTCHAYMCGVVGARQQGQRERLEGGLPGFLTKLQGRIGAIHLIDSDGSLHGDETSTHAPFGKGNIDFHSLAPQLMQVPNIDWWCVDLCFWAGSWELVNPSLQFVRELLAAKSVVG